VSITQPSSNASFTIGAPISLKANATDSNGSVVRVDYYATTISGPIAFSTIGPEWTATWNTSAIAPGSYTLTAVATDNGGATGTSTGIPITLVASNTPVPPPWVTQDIGNVGLAGSAAFSAGTWTVNGSGANIAASADAFRFVYQTLPADGQIIARVASIQSTQEWTKVGLMIRDGLASNARNVSLLVTPSGYLYFQYRYSAGGTTSSTIAAVHLPVWLKLTRAGSTITVAYSSNGITYSTLGVATSFTSGPVMVGLAVSSSSTSVLATGTFDNVTGP
jgi:regulation of enolase protein 1 (concanavalin A-like superfamily)